MSICETECRVFQKYDCRLYDPVNVDGQPLKEGEWDACVHFSCRSLREDAFTSAIDEVPTAIEVEGYRRMVVPVDNIDKPFAKSPRFLDIGTGTIITTNSKGLLVFSAMGIKLPSEYGDQADQEVD
jgi:hypothetical protein